MSVPAYSLTRVERWAVAVIQDFLDGGVGPSLDQIAGAMGRSKGNVHRILTQLETKGWIMRLPNTARSITLIHRLSPAPARALVELGECLAASVASADGMVRLTVPKPMVDAALAAIGVKAA